MGETFIDKKKADLEEDPNKKEAAPAAPAHGGMPAGMQGMIPGMGGR